MPVRLLLAALFLSAAAPADDRLLLIFAADAGAPQLLAQRAALDDVGLRARDVTRIEVVGDTVTGATNTAATLRRRYEVDRGAFRVVLVGKDGGVKLDERAPISAATLHATIDAMPMRRQEMRR